MKKLNKRNKTTALVIIIFSLLLVGTILAQNNSIFFTSFAANLSSPTPTPQPARPKRKTTKTEMRSDNPLSINSLTGQGDGNKSTTTQSNLAQILASADFNLIGLVGTVNPATQTVPKNIPTAVLTSIQVPDGSDPAPIIAQLNPNYRIRGELSGPSLTAPRMIQAKIGEPLQIPPLPNVGDHVLQNLRIVDITDPTNSTLAPVAPDSVGITVIDNILVTQVQVTEMTYEQIIQSGINLNNGNYTFYNFVIGLGTSSGTIPIQIPVALPTTGGQIPVVGTPTGGVGVGGVSVPLPDIVPVMLEGVDEEGNPAPVELPGGGTMQIPGVVVFPGRIGLLHQFFEAIVIVANGAPNGTPLVITNLKAKAKLPNAGTPANPDDDPLRIAETQTGGVQTELDIHGLGADGRYGTADDTISFNPGQSGQATFLLEGLKEGLHTVDFDLEGTLQGLPSGNVTVHGTVPGAVLVRDAEFGVTFTHPSVVRAGQEYDLGLTIYNSGHRNINGIALNLRGDSVSGATLIDSEVKMLNQTIAPGSSGTVKWRLRSNTTGQVTASYIKVGEGIDAGLNLVTGVGDRNIPLSPDSLILPEPVRHLPPDVVEAARQMLGQSWSIATAPAGSLPSGVLPVDKQVVVGKAIELGWAGLRIDFHEDRDTSLRTLLRDWLGENQSNSSTGFADALRNTPAGYYFFDTVGTKFFESVGTESPSDFHKKLVAAESSRSSFISAFVSQTGGQQILGAKINSPTNQSVGFGANSSQRFGDLQTGASLNLLQNDPHNSANGTKGNLLVVSKPTTSGNWSLEINGWADGAADISILAPTSGKNYRQLIFGNVAVTAGKRYRITFRATGTTAPVTEEFINGAFQPVNLPFTSSDVNDPNPEITGLVQITDNVIEGGDKFGRLVGVLFSKPMVKTSVESINRYQVGGGALVSDPSQIVGKLIKPTSSVQNFGGRFAIMALDSPVGPYIKRTVTANNIADVSGKIVSNSTKDIDIRVSPQGNPPGGYLTGRVMQADGTPVPNAGIYYRRMKPSAIDPTAPCGPLSNWETVSYQKADSNGEYAIDYVREGDCHPVTVLFQNPATNSEKTLVSNVAYNGQHLIFNAVFLARGNVQGTVTSGGIPLANANVSILSELDPLNNKLVRTNAQGFYSATGLPVGGLTVKAVGTGAYSLSSGISGGNLSEAGGTVTIDVTTQNVSGIIKGKVRDSGSGQPPVANSLVVAKANIPGFPGQYGAIPVGYAFTQQDGSFTIDRLPIGNVFLEATDPQRGIGTSTTVQLTPQTPKAENVLLLISNGFGRVAGKVLNEIGQEIPNAVVQEGAQAVRADASGNYVLPQTREGNVTITATDPITRQSGSTTISVRRNEDTNGANVVIRRPANLNGQVFITENGTTAPLAQAYVSVDGRKIVRTDSQGRYTLNDIQSGTTLTIRFVHPQGRLFVNTDVFLNPGETLSRNASFKPSRVHGKITQPDGVTPVLTGVSYSTLRPHLNQDVFFGLPESVNLTYQTTTDGLYSFESLNPIDYRVSASNVFFPVPVSQSGILAPNADLEINLSLVDTLAGKIHGHIYQPDGTTPVGAGVKVSLGGGSLADVTVRTDAEGYYEFAEVFAEGGYLLTATDPLTNRTNQTNVSIRKNQEITVDLRLLGRGTLRVKAIDGGGSPLQNGSIRIEGSAYPNDQRYVELTPSNNGEFEFTNLTEGTYAVSALYQSLGGRVAGTVTLNGTTIVTVQVQAVGSITGRVFMPNGTAPVGLADVTLRQNGRIIGLITTQDSEEERGKFNFTYVPTGDFTIDVFDNRTGRSGRSAGTITEQGQIANINVNLLALGTVVGQVTSNGVPAEHALVNLSADGSGISATSRIATTDSNGNFRFPGVPVGLVSIYVSNGPGGLRGSSQGIIAGTNEPLPDTVIDVALTPTATITGTVRKFGGTENYSGALVTITSNNFYSNTTTDENGRYRVNFVPLGTVNVKVESPFGYDRGKSEPVVSNQPGAILTADVTMSGVGNINGTATDSNGNPLAFGKVTFTNSAWGEYISVVAPIQPNGTYSMSGLPTGEYNLKLTVPEIIGVGTATDTLAGSQTAVKNLQLEQAGKIFGNVKSPDGASPAVGADVSLFLTKQGGGYYNFITHTNSSGNWSIENLPLGTISVRISDPNSGGSANLAGLVLNANGQQLDAGSVVLDNSPVTVVSVTPANNSVNVATDSTVQIVFSEPVDAGSVNSNSVKLKLGSNQVSASSAISNDGMTVTLTPSQNLAEAQTFSVVVTSQVKDLNGNNLVQEFTSTFATADESAPRVTQISPANGSIQIPIDSSIVLNISEVIAPDLNLAGIVQVTDGGQNAVAGTLSLSNTGRVITFVPTASLSESTIYTVNVNGLRDLVGNVQTQAFTSNFTTIDSTPPTISPLAIDGTNVSTPRPTITANYQDNASGINPASVNFSLDGVQITSNLSVSAQSVSYQPAQNLSLGSHTVSVRVADFAGNLSEIRTATFTVSDGGAPLVTAVSPTDNAIQVALDAVITVNFDETLEPTQNPANILKVTAFSESVPENGSYSLSGDGKSISFTPANLTAGNRYVIAVNGQKDIFGNTQTQAFHSVFTTIDTTLPVITNFSINGRAAYNGMAISTPRPSFQVNYEDELGIDTINTKLYLGKIGEPLQQVNATVYNRVLYYQSAEPLEGGTYKVRAVVKDAAGNEALNNEFDFEFAAQQPEILTISPNYSPTSGNMIASITGSQLISGSENPDASLRGLAGEYYECYYINCLDNLKLGRLDETVNFEVFDESIVPYINKYSESIRWRGKIIPRYSETYNFSARFNGQFVLKIDGQTLIDTRSISVFESENTITLEADQSYDIEIQNSPFYSSEGGYSFGSQHIAQLSWSSPSQTKEIVPAAQLRPAAKSIAPTVTVGGQAATVIGAVSGDIDKLSIIAPPHAAGSVDVQVQNENGTALLGNGFEYYTDENPPYVVNYSPETNRITAVLPTHVSVTFNEPLAPAQNFNNVLKVKKNSDNSEIAGTVTIDETFRRLTFVPTNPFVNNSVYRIVVQGQVNTVGTANNGLSESVFTTTDTIAPVVVFQSPNAETYTKRPTISATFEDALSSIQRGSVKLFVDEVNVTSSTNIYYKCTGFCFPYYSTNGLTFTPPTNLSFGAHTARVQVADGAGNIANETRNFTIAVDQVPPTFTTIRIADQEFTEGLRTAQRQPYIAVNYQDNYLINANRQKLYFGTQGGTLEQVSPNYYFTGYMYYIPPQELPFGFYSYRVELTDDENNTTVRTFNFEVADLDITPPSVTAVSPEYFATQVNTNTNITLTFSEPLNPNQNFADSVTMQNANGDGIGVNYQLDAAGTILTLTPIQTLEENTRYIVVVRNYLDLADNIGYEFVTTFSTNDTVAPAIEPGQLYLDDDSRIPLNGADILDRKPEIIIIYNDATNYVDPDSVIFTLDGQAITNGVSYYAVDYRPETPLSYGLHTITVQAADIVGNMSEVKTETFTVSRDARTPFVVEPDTTLLWHLDEADYYGSRLTPDAGNYRIHGIFPPQSSLTAPESKSSVSKSTPESKSSMSKSSISKSTKSASPDSKSTKSKSSDASYFNPTPRGRFGGALSNLRVTSIEDENIGSLGSDGLTVEGWMKMSIVGGGNLQKSNNLTENPYVIWRKGDGSAADFEFLLTAEGDLKARIINAAGTAFEIEMPKTVYDVTDDRWHSLAFTVEKSGGNLSRMVIYADGAPRAEANVPSNFGAIRNSGGKFQLGFGNYPFDPMFDEIRISSTAHSAETINKTYNSADLGLIATRHSPPVVPSDNTTEINVEGYNLDTVTGVGVTALDGSPLPIAATINENSTKTSLKVKVTVDAAVPNGEVKLSVTNGQTTLVRNLQIVAQRAFVADAGSLLLFHLNEPDYENLVNSGTLGGFGINYNEAARGRFGNGRNGFSTDYQMQIPNFVNSSFTSEFWMKTRMPTEDSSLLVYGNNYDGGDFRIFDLKLSVRNQLKAVINDVNDLKWQTETQLGAMNLFDDQWHLISMVVTRGSQPNENTLKIFVDGAEKSSAVMPAGFASIESHPSYRFYLNDFRYPEIEGEFDEARLLTYARPAADIYNSWFGINTSGIGILLPKLINPADRNNRTKAIQKDKTNLSDPLNLKDAKKQAAEPVRPAEEKPPPKNKLIIGRIDTRSSEKKATNR